MPKPTKTWIPEKEIPIEEIQASSKSDKMSVGFAKDTLLISTTGFVSIW